MNKSGGPLLISIITPSYEQGAWIEENILSVAKQHYARFEHVVIDGGSADSTLEVLGKYKHVKWVSEPDDGPTHALNRALAIARGDVIGWLNADDVYLPGTFETVGNYFSANREAKVLTGGCYIIDSNGSITDYGASKLDNWRDEVDLLSRRHLRSREIGVHAPGTFFTREVLDTVGWFNTDYQHAMDYEFFIRVAQRFTFHSIEQPLAAARRHPGAISIKSRMTQIHETYDASRIYWGTRWWARGKLWVRCRTASAEALVAFAIDGNLRDKTVNIPAVLDALRFAPWIIASRIAWLLALRVLLGHHRFDALRRRVRPLKKAAVDGRLPSSIYQVWGDWLGRVPGNGVVGGPG